MDQRGSEFLRGYAIGLHDGAALEMRPQPNYPDQKMRLEPKMSKAELQRLKDRIDRILNDVLCDMKPGWDDSIEGFNKAWDITRDIFKEEIDRATA